MKYEKILIIRTDRLGDVLLSTPVIQAVRSSLPSSYIAFMTSPYTKDIVMGNPYLDEIIIYDKNLKHSSHLATILFGLSLREYKFDLVLVLHSTFRTNLIAYLAGAHRRIGYARKAAWFLTDKIPYLKSQGLKHESEYTLDVVRAAGIDFDNKELKPFLPISKGDQDFVDGFCKAQGLIDKDILIGIHPSSSCPSRRWPPQKFAELADRLIGQANSKIIIFGIGEDLKFAEIVKNNMKHSPFIVKDFTIPQAAALLKRCRFFISTDTGPAHIASAVGVPCITIFGRKQPGLSPVRWKPLGEETTVLHKDVGCTKCLAHNCKKQFLCLNAITTDEVFNAAKKFLQS